MRYEVEQDSLDTVYHLLNRVDESLYVINVVYQYSTRVMQNNNKKMIKQPKKARGGDIPPLP